MTGWFFDSLDRDAEVRGFVLWSGEGRRWRLIVLLLFLLTLSRGASIPPVELGPQQQVRTRNPKMGVHTRLTDEVELWKIKRSLVMVRQMGAPWIVAYFPWAYSEPRDDQFNWEHAEQVVAHARRQGLKVVARVDYVPQWARSEDTTYRYLGEEHYDDYADFIQAFVEHFRGRLWGLIVWNEPNLSVEWGYRSPDPQAYTDLLRLAYRRAKEADPSVRVLAAGLAPTLGDTAAKSSWMSDLAYLQGMYDAGAAPYFDLLAAHAYGWNFPADDPPGEDKVNFRRVELLRDVMVRNGDADKQVMITEGGWNDHPRWTKAVRPYQRVAYTLQAYDMALEWGWLKAMAMWVFRLPWQAHSYQDYFTFVDVDFVPKPIYLEVQRYANGEGQPELGRKGTRSAR